MVPEMVFLLGKMGDNKRALNLIIERLGDVNRVSGSICSYVRLN
jgi:vacuolar protein sorting-associated protein 41